MNRSALLRTLALSAALIAVLCGVAIAVFSRHDAEHYKDFAGTPVTPPKAATDFVLRTGSGSDAHLLDGTATVTYLFFGYTHCPDVCPLALATLGRAYRTLPHDRAARVRIAFVTVDPKRDTPPVAAAFVRNFDSHIVAYTGSQAALTPVWQAYGVPVDAASHEVVHGDTIDAIDAAGRIVLVYPPDVSARDLAADMTRFSQ